MAVWNEYHRAWTNGTIIPQTQVLVIKYEDLTLSPLLTLNRMLAATSQAPIAVESFVSADANAKADHYGLTINRRVIEGKPRTRLEIIASLNKKEYLSAFSSEQLGTACAKLDHQLLRQYGYEQDCSRYTHST
jgi:hypothetical protein